MNKSVQKRQLSPCHDKIFCAVYSLLRVKTCRAQINILPILGPKEKSAKIKTGNKFYKKVSMITPIDLLQNSLVQGYAKLEKSALILR